MTKQQLYDILQKGESVSFEAKSARGGFPDSFWETYSAFANTHGGIILLGIKEKHDHTLTIDGLADAEKTIRDLWNMANNRQKVNRNILSDKMVYILNIEGKDVLVVEVPRAERTARPIYKGQDPFLGTYRRYNEGDHLCTAESVGAMMRDASLMPMDAKTVDNMDMSALCQDSIDAYFRIFKASNPNHLWSKLELDIFLRRIRAVDIGEDGKYHPTEAGLLMFGYEYEITRRFPQYFLDYQEERQLIGVTRWKDRITSATGDWSGNVFDFVFKILNRLQSDLKVPFVMRGIRRIDDTPMHKLLREATINTLVHADYNGRQGVLITKGADGFTFANPGRMRIPVEEAIGGGVSDPRNSTLLKMFSFIRFGERAGSGLNAILFIWEKVYHAQAHIAEKESEADRTILTLPYEGHEQDVQAMLQFYDNPTELTLEDFNIHQNDKTIQKEDNTIQNTIQKEDNTIQKTDGLTEQQKAILSYLAYHTTATRKEIQEHLPGASLGGIIHNLTRLQRLGLLKRVGGRRDGHWETMM